MLCQTWSLENILFNLGVRFCVKFLNSCFCQASVCSYWLTIFLCLILLQCYLVCLFVFWGSWILSKCFWFLAVFCRVAGHSGQSWHAFDFLCFLQVFQEWTISASGLLPKSENIYSQCFLHVLFKLQRQTFFFIYGQKTTMKFHYML